MKENDNGVVIIIPTRNRAELASKAIRSVLDQPNGNIRILVSDNSTLPREIEKLRLFCNQCDDTRLNYIRPPEPMTMSEHWDWVIRQALNRHETEYFSVLTDRFIWKKNTLTEVIKISDAYPNRVISYAFDYVDDIHMPITLNQRKWTGKVLAINSENILSIYGNACECEHQAPRLLNCFIPRRVFQQIQSQFSNVCLSISPDYCFAFRCLTVVDEILHYDKPVFIQHALAQSNGGAMYFGPNQANRDFLAHMPSEGLFLSPTPEIMCLTSSLSHEYCLAKKESQSPKFRELNMKCYFESVMHDLDAIQVPELREKYLGMLKKYCVVSLPKNDQKPKIRLIKKLRSLLSVLRWSAQTKPFWILIARFAGPDVLSKHRFTFKTTQEAIDFANNYSIRKTSSLGDEYLKFKVIRVLSDKIC